MDLAVVQVTPPEEMYIIPLVAGLVLSMVGSLPPGMISLTVAQSAVSKGIRPAIWMAVGASLVEVLQARFSFELVGMYGETEGLKTGFHILAALIFTGLALYHLLQTPTPPKAHQQAVHTSRALFSGLWVGALNVMAFPYWMFYGTYLEMHALVPGSSMARWSMSLGVGAGTFLLLTLYALAGQKLVSRLPMIAQRTNQFLGFLLLLLAVIQVVSLLR